MRRLAILGCALTLVALQLGLGHGEEGAQYPTEGSTTPNNGSDLYPTAEGSNVRKKRSTTMAMFLLANMLVPFFHNEICYNVQGIRGPLYDGYREHQFGSKNPTSAELARQTFALGASKIAVDGLSTQAKEKLKMDWRQIRASVKEAYDSRNATEVAMQREWGLHWDTYNLLVHMNKVGIIEWEQIPDWLPRDYSTPNATYYDWRRELKTYEDISSMVLNKAGLSLDSVTNAQQHSEQNRARWLLSLLKDMKQALVQALKSAREGTSRLHHFLSLAGASEADRHIYVHAEQTMWDQVKRFFGSFREKVSDWMRGKPKVWLKNIEDMSIVDRIEVIEKKFDDEKIVVTANRQEATKMELGIAHRMRLTEDEKALTLLVTLRLKQLELSRALNAALGEYVREWPLFVEEARHKVALDRSLTRIADQEDSPKMAQQLKDFEKEHKPRGQEEKTKRLGESVIRPLQERIERLWAEKVRTCREQSAQREHLQRAQNPALRALGEALPKCTDGQCGDCFQNGGIERWAKQQFDAYGAHKRVQTEQNGELFEKIAQTKKQIEALREELRRERVDKEKEALLERVFPLERELAQMRSVAHAEFRRAVHTTGPDMDTTDLFSAEQRQLMSNLEQRLTYLNADEIDCIEAKFGLQVESDYARLNRQDKGPAVAEFEKKVKQCARLDADIQRQREGALVQLFGEQHYREYARHLDENDASVFNLKYLAMEKMGWHPDVTLGFFQHTDLEKRKPATNSVAEEETEEILPASFGVEEAKRRRRKRMDLLDTTWFGFFNPVAFITVVAWNQYLRDHNFSGEIRGCKDVINRYGFAHAWRRFKKGWHHKCRAPRIVEATTKYVQNVNKIAFDEIDWESMLKIKATFEVFKRAHQLPRDERDEQKVDALLKKREVLFGAKDEDRKMAEIEQIEKGEPGGSLERWQRTTAEWIKTQYKERVEGKSYDQIRKELLAERPSEQKDKVAAAWSGAKQGFMKLVMRMTEEEVKWKVWKQQRKHIFDQWDDLQERYSMLGMDTEGKYFRLSQFLAQEGIDAPERAVLCWDAERGSAAEEKYCSKEHFYGLSGRDGDNRN